MKGCELLTELQLSTTLMVAPTSYILHATGIVSSHPTTLWSTNQLYASGSEVNGIAIVHGGKSNIITPCNINIPLAYRRGLMTLPIRKPTAVELEEYDHIDLSTTLWDPRKEFDTKLDKDDTLVVITPTADFNPANTLNIASTKEEPDSEWLCGCLLHKPMEVVKATWNATTKFLVNYSLAYPMKHHFKSRFPALNVERLKEMFAMATLFLSVKPIGGATCAQIYVGVKSNYMCLYNMTGESEFKYSLQDIIC